MLADLLGNDSDLCEVIVRCAHLTLPPCLALAVERSATERKGRWRAPSAATLSRAKLLLDTAFMLAWRGYLAEHLRSDGQEIMHYFTRRQQPSVWQRLAHD